MKLFYGKTSDKTCRHCGGTINREEVYVVDQLAAYGAGGTKSLFIIVHYDCYIPWKQKKLQAKYEAFVLSHRKPTRMGRKPLPCIDRPRRRKLLSLRAYHTKAGNLKRAAEITLEIRALEIGTAQEALEPCGIIEKKDFGGDICLETPVQEQQSQNCPTSLGETSTSQPPNHPPDVSQSPSLPLDLYSIPISTIVVERPPESNNDPTS